MVRERKQHTNTCETYYQQPSQQNKNFKHNSHDENEWALGICNSKAATFNIEHSALCLFRNGKYNAVFQVVIGNVTFCFLIKFE